MSVLLTRPGSALGVYGKSGGVVAPLADRFTYYVSTSGDDAAAGTKAAPWRTLAKILTHGIAPGQSVGLKRGDHWRESLHALDAITGSYAPLYTRIGAYGVGALPIIDGSDVHTSGWVSMSTTAGFSAPVNPNPNFATWTAADPTTWTLDNYAGAACALTKVMTDSPTETNSIQWVRTGAGLARILGMASGIASGSKTYALRVTAKRTSGTQALTVGVSVNSGGAKWLQADGTWLAAAPGHLPVTGVSDAWQTLTVRTGIIPPEGVWYQVEVRDNSANGTTLIDSIEIVEEIPATTSPLYTKDGLGSQVGITMLDGAPLPWVEWTTSGGEATAVAALTTAPSGFAHNRAGKVYVHLPGGADPNGLNVEVGVRKDCITIGDVNHVSIRGIHLRGAAGNGCTSYSMNSFIFDVKATCCGGYWDPVGFYVGNGLEVAGNSSDIQGTILGDDIFDTAFSPQLYNTVEEHITGCTVRVTAHRCGLSGIELQIQSYAHLLSSIDDTVILNPVIVDSGKGWSGVRTNINHDFSFGNGIFLSTQSGTTKSLSGVRIVNPTITGSAGQAIWAGQNTGRVLVEGGRLSGNTLGGVYIMVGTTTDTTALTITDAVIHDNGGPGLYHNNWYGGIPSITGCTFARNGSGADANVWIDGVMNPDHIHDNVFEGVGREAIRFTYDFSVADTSGNIYHRTDAGNVVVRNSVGYTTQAEYRAAAEADASFTNPLFHDPANGDYTRP